MTRCGVMQCTVRVQHALVIARKERSEGRGNPSCLVGDDRLVSSLTGSQWIATGYALAMTRYGLNLCTVRGQHTMSLRGRNEVSDAAIHCMQWRRTDKCGSLTGTQWIATGFALAMTKNIIQPISMQSTALHLSLQKAQKETSRVAICSQKIFSFSSIFIP